jgi:hypothetical protein
VQTIRLWRPGSFATTRSFTGAQCLRSIPTSAAAALPSASSRARNSESIHARATIRAPFAGCACSRNVSIAASRSRSVKTFAASNAATSALTRFDAPADSS